MQASNCKPPYPTSSTAQGYLIKVVTRGLPRFHITVPSAFRPAKLGDDTPNKATRTTTVMAPKKSAAKRTGAKGKARAAKAKGKATGRGKSTGKARPKAAKKSAAARKQTKTKTKPVKRPAALKKKSTGQKKPKKSSATHRKPPTPRVSSKPKPNPGRDSKKFKERKGPVESATNYPVGTVKVGRDGNMWIVRANVLGIQSWKKLSD